MPRFIKVMGVAGQLVTDPRHAFSEQARYIGMQRLPDTEGLTKEQWAERGLKKGDCYAPVEQVIPDDNHVGTHVRRAVAKGSLIQIGKPVVAASMDKAVFAAPAAAKKGG